jgi:hypothetical protein
MLTVVRVRPDLLLLTARICFKLRRPRRAFDAVAVVSAMGVRQIADPDRAAEQMMKIAAALCTHGLPVEAEDVLRKALALVPHTAAPRTTLILLLQEDLRASGGNLSLEQWTELEHLLQKSIVDAPNLAGPRLALAACLRQKARYLESRTAPDAANAAPLRVKAGDLLRAAVAEEPYLPAPRLALADFLLENLRYLAAETVATAAVRVNAIGPRFRTFSDSLLRAREAEWELGTLATDNIVRHSRRAEITTLHEVLWMRPRVPPTPPM